MKTIARLAACLVSLALAGGATSALAQQRIGAATSIQNDVSRVRGAAAVGLGAGDPVFRDETVATGAASSARLTFLDDTNLAIGPTSRVALDRFVFSGDASAQALSVNLARGAFRFTTGALDKRAYKINSPVATIGVRGTVLDILITGGRTIVTLVDNGQALACTRNQRQCAQLLQPGDTVVIDATGARRTNAPGSRFSFAQYCVGNPSLCGGGGAPATQFAQGGDALCGR